MEKPLLLASFLTLSLAAGLAFADPEGAKPSTYVDGTYGFSLNAPRFPAAERRTATVFQASAAPVDGFEANLNVQVQPMNMDRDQYRKLSLAQFAKEGWKVTVDRDLTVSGHDAVFWEFEGKSGDEEYGWIALAVIDKPRVILATCTSLKRHLAEHEKEFRASLDSFRLAP